MPTACPFPGRGRGEPEQPPPPACQAMPTKPCVTMSTWTVGRKKSFLLGSVAAAGTSQGVLCRNCLCLAWGMTSAKTHDSAILLGNLRAHHVLVSFAPLSELPPATSIPPDPSCVLLAVSSLLLPTDSGVETRSSQHDLDSHVLFGVPWSSGNDWQAGRTCARDQVEGTGQQGAQATIPKLGSEHMACLGTPSNAVKQAPRSKGERGRWRGS